MATHTNSITAVDTTLGEPQSEDGIMAIISQAIAVSGTFLLSIPYLITSLTDLEDTYGITAAYDAANGLAFHQQVSEYYGEVPDGTLLWIMGISTENEYATWVAGNNLQSFIQTTVTAGNQALGIGFCYEVPASLQSASDFPTDVPATITALQTQFVNLFPMGMGFFAIVDGANMSSTKTPATIGTQATNSAFAVALCVSSTLGNGVSQIGMALGRNAKIAIGDNMSNSQDGAVSQVTAFLTNSILVPTTGTLIVGHTYYVIGGTVLYNGVTYQTAQTFVAVEGFTSYTTADTGYVLDNATPMASLGCCNIKNSLITQLAAKQYLFVGTLFGKSGFYWNDGGTCIAATNAFCDIAYVRVLNHLGQAALTFFSDQYGSTPATTESTGALDPTFTSGMQEAYYGQYIEPINQASGTGQIVDGALTISAPNYATNPNITYTLKVIRKSVIGNITGTFSFVATL